MGLVHPAVIIILASVDRPPKINEEVPFHYAVNHFYYLTLSIFIGSRCQVKRVGVLIFALTVYGNVDVDFVVCSRCQRYLLGSD